MGQIKLAIDAMGGDIGLAVTLPAAAKALAKYPQLTLLLVGDEHLIEPYQRKYPILRSDRCSVIHAPQVVAMDELPSHALRNKKNSSMRLAINLVKEGRAQACVSAGNTGALMATARFVLKTMPGIDRPAIISEMPRKSSRTWMLDLGANVDSCAEHLYQFAVMGAVLVSVLGGKSRPKVGLLNIGVEEIKGNDQVKRTALMLADNQNMNYIGFVEGDDIYLGPVDLVVCDGFVGNVAIKSSEGVARLMGKFIREEFKRNALTRMVGLFAKPVLNRIKKRMDPSEYNGASLLGLNGIVVKSHGSANVRGFIHAIDEAVIEVQNNVPELIRKKVSDFLAIEE